MSPEEPPPLWSTEQLAEYLGIGVQTVHALRRRGEAPRAYRVGRVLRFEPAEVVEWLHELRDDPRPDSSAEDGEPEPRPADEEATQQPADHLADWASCARGSE